MWAVLPAKDLADAKQRLAGALSPQERRLLFRTMYEDVLAAVAKATRLDGLLVVTRDPEAAAVAEDYGTRVMVEDANRGQSQAVEAAAAQLAAEGIASILTVPGDAPLITSDEIDAVISAHGSAPSMTIVPSHDGRGSNCVALSPPRLIPFRFGNDSFRPHLAEARTRGVEPLVLDLPGIALDIDTPDDLRALLARPAATRTHRYLEASSIAARLLAGPDRLSATR